MFEECVPLIISRNKNTQTNHQFSPPKRFLDQWNLTGKTSSKQISGCHGAIKAKKSDFYSSLHLLLIAMSNRTHPVNPFSSSILWFTFLFPFSDHSAVLLSSSVPQAVTMGSGLWKLNVSVLEELDYFRLISDFWAGWQHRMPAFPSLSDWWEMGKSRIKGLTIDYCCRHSKSKSPERDLLARLASHLKFRLYHGVLSCLQAYKSVLERLAALDLVAAKGAQVCSCIRWVEEGESSSAFFFCLEKKRAADRLISGFRLDDGSVVNSTTGLLEAFSSFYSKLFSAQPCDPHAQSELLSRVLSSLTVDESSSCEGNLSLEECFAALSLSLSRKVTAWTLQIGVPSRC